MFFSTVRPSNVIVLCLYKSLLKVGCYSIFIKTSTVGKGCNNIWRCARSYAHLFARMKFIFCSVLWPRGDRSRAFVMGRSHIKHAGSTLNSGPILHPWIDCVHCGASLLSLLPFINEPTIVGRINSELCIEQFGRATDGPISLFVVFVTHLLH